jgi:hypothetical protein
VDYIVLEDSTDNRVVVHKIERLHSNIWTATFTAYADDKVVLHEETATYQCWIDTTLLYETGPYKDGSEPHVNMRETICDALWLAWLREYRQQRLDKRTKARPTSAEIPQSRERGLRT